MKPEIGQRWSLIDSFGRPLFITEIAKFFECNEDTLTKIITTKCNNKPGSNYWNFTKNYTDKCWKHLSGQEAEQ